jgi:hypothetical protein
MAGSGITIGTPVPGDIGGLYINSPTGTSAYPLVIQNNGAQAFYVEYTGKVVTAMNTLDDGNGDLTAAGTIISNDGGVAYHCAYSQTGGGLYWDAWMNGQFGSGATTGNSWNLYTTDSSILFTVPNEAGGTSSFFTSLYVSGTVTQGSDQRLKESIVTIDSDATTDKVMALRPVSYNMIDNKSRVRYGFIAQEMQEIFPDVVQENTNGMLGVSYTELIAPLLAVVQQQQRSIAELQQRLLVVEKSCV